MKKLTSIFLTFTVLIFLLCNKPIGVQINWSDLIGDVPSCLYGKWNQQNGPLSYNFNENRTFEIYRYGVLNSFDGVYFPASTTDSIGLEYGDLLYNVLVLKTVKYSVNDSVLILGGDTYLKE